MNSIDKINIWWKFNDQAKNILQKYLIEKEQKLENWSCRKSKNTKNTRIYYLEWKNFI